MPRRCPRSILLVDLLASAAPAIAQLPAADPAQDAPPPVATEAPTQEGGRVYTAADFARFAPRNAYDMLSQVPGFS